MEELDLLRAHWKQNKEKFAKVPREELYRMIHKKSSSTVKWILIISLIELCLILGSTLLPDDDEGSLLIKSLKLEHILVPMSVINYGVIIAFCFIFYRNYKKIQLTDSSKNLMASILRVRKTVTYYININLTFLVVYAVLTTYKFFATNPDMVALFTKAREKGKMLLIGGMAFVVSLIFIGLFIGLVWLYYKIIYGLLLKKLSRNYDDLKKLVEEE
jgi:hypothetical protein